MKNEEWLYRTAPDRKDSAAEFGGFGMRIRIWLALVLAGVLFFTGCGDQGGLHITPSDKGDSGDPGRVGVLTGVYRGEEIPLPDTFRPTEGAVRIDAAGYVTFCAGDADGQTHLLTLPIPVFRLIKLYSDRVCRQSVYFSNCFLPSCTVF